MEAPARAPTSRVGGNQEIGRVFNALLERLDRHQAVLESKC